MFILSQGQIGMIEVSIKKEKRRGNYLVKRMHASDAMLALTENSRVETEFCMVVSCKATIAAHYYHQATPRCFILLGHASLAVAARNALRNALAFALR